MVELGRRAGIIAFRQLRHYLELRGLVSLRPGGCGGRVGGAGACFTEQGVIASESRPGPPVIIGRTVVMYVVRTHRLSPKLSTFAVR